MRREQPAAALVEARLAKALIVDAMAARVDCTIAEHRSRPWASATFIGAQHAVTLVAPRSPGLGGWVAALPDAELPLIGHVVGSVAVDTIEDDGVAVTLTLCVLTIEDR